MGRGIAVAVALALLAGCLESRHTVCPGGRVCPDGTECDPEHDRCLLPGQADACDGIAENAPCAHPDGDSGFCDDGACVLAECGDGRVDPSEDCERGVAIDIDCSDLDFYHPDPLGCSSYCQFETDSCTGECGDAIVDRDAGETCEVDLPPDGSCLDYGFDAGRPECVSCGPGFERCQIIGWFPQRIPIAPTTTPRAASAAGDRLYVAGDTGDAIDAHAAVLERTGDTWSELGAWPWTSDWRPRLDAIHAFAPGEVIAVGSDGNDDTGIVERYHDGEWIEDTFPGQIFTLVWGSAPDDVFVAGHVADDFDLVVQHFDGRSWSPMDVPAPPTAARDLSGVAGDDVYLASFEDVLHWDGDEWSPVGSFDSPRAVHAVSATEVYVLDQDGLHRKDGDGWTPLGGPVNPLSGDIGGDQATGVYVMSHNNAATGVARLDDTGWADLLELTASLPAFDLLVAGDEIAVLGSVGTLLTHGGNTWRTIAAGGLVTHARGGPGDMVAVRDFGAGSEIVHIDQSGTIDPLWSSDSIRLTGLFRGHGDIWATYPGGTVHGDGDVWTTPDPGTGVGLRAIAGPAVDDLWVVGLEGVIRHWDGDAWSPVDSPVTVPLNDIGCRADGTCFAVGSEGTILRNPGYPAAWETMEIEGSSTPSLFAVWVDPDGTAAVATGELGALVALAGSTWHGQPSGTAYFLNDVAGAAPDDIFATGAGSSLVHWDGTAWMPVRMETGVNVEYLLGDPDARSVPLVNRNSSNILVLDRSRPWD
ncbi:MAG TPA: hypothetical protein VMZ28_14800 [Kofleriaceae bacterium]|nr:hypothetical protein [Kofleriaceae bacterium]